MENQNESPASPASKKNTYIVVGVVILIGLGWFLSRGSYILPGGVNVDKNLDGSATYKNGDTSVTVGKNTYPDNWPSDAPKYPNAQIQYSASSNPESGETGAIISFTTSDKLQQVIDFYKSELAKNGWKIEQTATVSQMTAISGSKDKMTYSVQIVSDDKGNTTVTVAIGK